MDIYFEALINFVNFLWDFVWNEFLWNVLPVRFFFAMLLLLIGWLKVEDYQSDGLLKGFCGTLDPIRDWLLTGLSRSEVAEREKLHKRGIRGIVVDKIQNLGLEGF